MNVIYIFYSNVYGWSIDFAQSSWFAASIPTVATDSMHSVWPVQAMRTWHVGLRTSSGHRVYRSYRRGALLTGCGLNWNNASDLLQRSTLCLIVVLLVLL